ncbi:MAG: FAD-dependent oxidoreductase [Pseudomonadota bacterium]
MKHSRHPFTRRTFITFATAVASSMIGCSSTGSTRSAGNGQPFNGSVLIVGAGPAGMAVAHLLKQRGVPFQLLEASGVVGGRTRHNLDFTDYPLSLGAEWVHVEAEILDEIVNDESVTVTTQLTAYDSSARVDYYANGEIESLSLDDSDLKFSGSSWLDFFTTYLLPGIADQIMYDTQVVDIDYSGPGVRITDSTGGIYVADLAVVTVPLAVLKRGDIEFTPALPAAKQQVIDTANVWSGLKVFIEFDDPFYPAFVAFEDSETDEGQRLYYDASYGQQTSANVLGLFSVGKQAERYQALSDTALLTQILAELDAVYDGRATASYRRHLVQNWNAEPFAAGAYLADVSATSVSRRLAEPVADKLLFAGEAYTSFDDWGGVHAATRSAAEAVDWILS